MAKFKSPAEFINSNVSLLADRQSSMYVAFLESKPTFTTYYHINRIQSETDKGLKIPEKLSGALSPIRYNKLLNFPLYGIEQIQLQLEEDEEGLNSDYSGEAIILPNTIHPSVDDYFIIDYLDKKYMFRITMYNYDTIKSNNFYKIEFTLHTIDVDFFNQIENQVVRTYHTIYENIGTHDNVFLLDEDNSILEGLKDLYDGLAKDYLSNYYFPYRDPYNTLLFVAPSETWNSDFDMLFDQNLVHFCNKNQLFYEHDTTEAVFFYEEPRKYFIMDYRRSIYDIMEHYESARIGAVTKFYDLEPTASFGSIFMFYRDKRVKYIRTYIKENNFYGKPIDNYLDNDFIASVMDKSIEALTNPIDIFISQWLINREDTDTLVKLTEDIEKNHNEYSFHNYIYIPLLLFCLADLYNRILNTSHMDELGNELICENV